MHQMKSDIEKIAQYYGYDNQSMQLIEEMAELTQAINHLRRIDNYEDVKSRQAVFEEIADVEIMLEQIKYLLNCHDEVESMKKYKVNRQLGRVEHERKRTT